MTNLAVQMRPDTGLWEPQNFILPRGDMKHQSRGNHVRNISETQSLREFVLSDFVFRAGR
jgi:hypothetical protein